MKACSEQNEAQEEAAGARCTPHILHHVILILVGLFYLRDDLIRLAEGSVAGASRDHQI